MKWAGNWKLLLYIASLQFFLKIVKSLIFHGNVKTEICFFPTAMEKHWLFNHGINYLVWWDWIHAIIISVLEDITVFFYGSPLLPSMFPLLPKICIFPSGTIFWIALTKMMLAFITQQGTLRLGAFIMISSSLLCSQHFCIKHLLKTGNWFWN